MTSFGWNYPPGVTGREWQIAGPSAEYPQQVVCEEQDVTLKIVDTRGKVVEVEVEQCPFEGEVDVAVYGRTTYCWTCPFCGREHEDEIEESGPDPDLQREMLMEERWDR